MSINRSTAVVACQRSGELNRIGVGRIVDSIFILLEISRFVWLARSWNWIDLACLLLYLSFYRETNQPFVCLFGTSVTLGKQPSPAYRSECLQEKECIQSSISFIDIIN
ncbi:unnamed protein product [Hermetia illucens]|uniref:Uncharacterized protein n=1 Tax=Hermetia illucens TaxID=343691 RepID=A0A7R8UF99_HERIL|nr:unnamed protein product [Hermetia illucens]